MTQHFSGPVRSFQGFQVQDPSGRWRDGSVHIDPATNQPYVLNAAGQAVALGQFTPEENATLKRVADKPGVVKTLNTLAYTNSLNTSDDTSHVYLAHIDITPEEFPFFEAGFILEAEYLVEAGVQGALPTSRVTSSSVVRNIAVRVGVPGPLDFAAMAALPSVSATAMSASNVAAAAKVSGVSPGGGGGGQLILSNIGAASYGVSSNAIISASNTFGANGLRVVITSNYASAVANNIVKCLKFKVEVSP
jgi:hypothetical protein